MKNVAVILAGGRGPGLWPRGTDKMPKQFQHVLGNGTMIQNTVQRISPLIPAEQTWVVTTQQFEGLVREQLPELPEGQIVCEPFGRNTGPSIALTSTLLKFVYSPDTVLAFLPSDHLIQNSHEFQAVLNQACHAARTSEMIVTIGVLPTRPETNYGYIQVGNPYSANGQAGDKVYYVHTFAEKPDPETALRFLNAGDFVWNSGIFVARIDVLLRAITTFLPDHAPLFASLERHVNKETYHAALETIFRQIRSISFDVGVMEKAENILVVDGAFGWSDVGTWDEVYRLVMKDGKNNVLEGNVIALNTGNSLISALGGKIVGVVGVENLVVVDTEEALMICPRGQTNQVREIVDVLRRRHIG